MRQVLTALKRAGSRGHGFTLVELMALIALLSVLAALLLPALSRGKQKAQGLHCASNLRQLSLGLESFIAENHLYPTVFGGTNADYAGDWMHQLEQGGFDHSKSKKQFWEEGVWKCPSARWNPHNPPLYDPPFCYGYNGFGVCRLRQPAQLLGLGGQPTPWPSPWIPVRESDVVRPSELMAIADSFDGDGVFTRGTWDHKEHVGFASTRHAGKVNIVLCDGHVESPLAKPVFTETNEVVLVRWNRDHLPHRERL